MESSLPSGIRYTNDLVYKDEIRSVKAMNRFCRQRGERFFFDTSDGDTFNIAGQHLIGLYGWIVPESEAERFEKEWKSEADLKDPEFGDKWYQTIIWEDRDGVATPIILD
ncbi:MAG: hypothetical protein LKG38_05490 [Atopobiaceae bacterium]|jgi:hypothetical protein|nr:hypothetical protein [Atopobiaceae bacterium]